MYSSILIDKIKLNRPKTEGDLGNYLKQLYNEYKGTQFEFCEVVLGECSKEINYLEDLEEKLKKQPPTNSIFATLDRNQTIKENLETISKIISGLRNRIIDEYENSIYSDKLKKWHEIAGSFEFSGKGYIDENGSEKILSVYSNKENKDEIYLYNEERLQDTYKNLTPFFKDPKNNGTIKPLEMLINDFLFKVESMALPSKERFTGLEIEKCHKFQKTDFYLSQWNLYGVLDLRKITDIINPDCYIMVYSTEKYLEFLNEYKGNGYLIKPTKNPSKDKKQTFEYLFRNKDHSKKVKEILEIKGYTTKGKWVGVTDNKTELLAAYQVLRPILQPGKPTTQAKIFYNEFGLTVAENDNLEKGEYITSKSLRYNFSNDHELIIEFSNTFSHILPKQ